MGLHKERSQGAGRRLDRPHKVDVGFSQIILWPILALHLEDPKTMAGIMLYYICVYQCTVVLINDHISFVSEPLSFIKEFLLDFIT